MTSRFYRCMLSISTALILASCTPMVDTRGHSGEAEDLKQVIVGQSSADDVTAILGSPTSTSSFGDPIWYYVTQKQERVGMFATKVAEQHVTAIAFDENKLVSSIAEYSKEDSKPVQIVRKTTPTEGHDFTVIEQMLGNLGRFNSPARGLSDRNKGR